MSEIGFCGNSWLIVSVLGFVFFLYITLICLLSPDRLHILTHENEHEDEERYSTAWSTAATSCFLYLLLGLILGFFKYSTQEDRERLRN